MRTTTTPIPAPPTSRRRHRRRAARLMLAALLAALPPGAASVAHAQTQNGERQQGGRDLAAVASSIEQKVENATVQLSAVREEIKDEKLPLSSELSTLEDKLLEVRKEYDRVLRIRDGRTLDVSNLKAQIKSREEQNKFLVNLLDEYARNLETRLHISEAQRYQQRFSSNQNTALDSNASLDQAFGARFDTLRMSFERLREALGGASFAGAAADPSGVIHQGRFAVFGPVAYFASDDGSIEGLADTKLGSNEPAIIPFPPGVDSGIGRLVAGEPARMPLDPTMGSAIQVAEETDTLGDEIAKGGAVMFPLLGLAGVSLLIGLYKWIRFLGIQRVSERQMELIMSDVNAHRIDAARAKAKAIRGPIGKMLNAAIRQLGAPRELIEEIIYERLLEAKSRLNSLLPFISITAAAAPLLGLLGTVTGMINTFKLITIFGTGDAQTFSSGISEALITTKWGLIVAIPSLLLYAFLSRRAKSVLDDMEKASVVFMNMLPEQTPHDGGDDTQDKRPDAAAERRPSADSGEPRPSGDDDGEPGPSPEGAPA
mgnify:CR=1 FL=1